MLPNKKRVARIELLKDFRADRITRIQFRNRYDARVERITNDVVRARVRDYIRKVREYNNSQWDRFIIDLKKKTDNLDNSYYENIISTSENNFTW